MKFLYTIFLSIILFSTGFSQYSEFDRFPGRNQGQVAGGFGLNWIDGDLYYAFGFRPEVSFLNFGVGLDLRIDVNKEGKIRAENFNEFSDYLSIIRYVRYGQKKDPFFIKLGALDYYTLGHGSVIYQYNNSPSFDSRKSGLVLDWDLGQFGFESIYSKFGEAGLAAVRGYIRPLQFTSAAVIPILGNLEVGATFAADFDERSGIISGSYDMLNKNFLEKRDAGRLTIMGADIGLPIINTSFFNMDLYADYTKIVDFGSGIATGVIFGFKGMGLVNAQAKLERRINEGKYLPAYFNSFYEIEKFRLDSTGNTGYVRSKAGILNAITDAQNGYYGELGVSVFNMFYVIGSYQRLDKDPDSGILHLNTEIAPEDFSIVARAGYDKINIRDEKDLFTLDDRSFLFFELGYKPMPYLLVSMVYNWTFEPQRDNDDKIISYKPQKRIEPRVSFMLPINFN